MALPEITRSTTAGKLKEVVDALEEAKSKTTNSVEKERFDQLIKKYSTAREKLVTICKNDIIKHNIFGDNASKLEVARLTRDNFKALSLEAWNNLIVAEENKHNSKELESKDFGQAAIDVLEGKTGITLMTGVKATLATAAVAALSSLNISAFAGALGFSASTVAALPTSFSVISIIPKVLTTLSALNPVIGVAAGVLMGIGAIKLTKKIFGPEIKKLWAKTKAEHKVREAFKSTKLENESKADISSYMDGKTPEDYETHMQDTIDHEDKRNNGTYANDFKTEAFKLATGTGKDLEKEVTKLRNKFKTKLTPAEIDQLLRECGIAPDQPDLGEIATDLKGDATFKKPAKGSTPSQSRKDFDQFKKDYKKIITTLSDPSVDATAKAKSIRDLRNFAGDASKFVDGSSAADIARQKKIQEICTGMVEIASELYAEIAKDASKVAQKDAILRQLESDRGLAEGQFNKL